MRTQLLPKNPDLWFVDETGLQLQTSLRKVVAPRGSKPTLRVTTSKEHIRIIGALRKSGQFLWRMVPTVNQEIVKHMLRQVKRRKGRGRSYVIWDQAGSHQAKSVQQLAYKKGMHLIFLPPYSPDLNPVEEIWRRLKRFLANYLFMTVPQLIVKVQQFFATHQQRFALNVANYFS